MFSSGFARELTRLGRLDASPEASLDRMTALAAREVPGCAGAGALVWLDGQVVQAAATHPDVGALLDLQAATGEGPHGQARRTGGLVVVADVIDHHRWPRYAAVALDRGVRSSLVLPLPAGGHLVTLGLDAVRPGVFDGRGTDALTVLLAGQIAAAVGNAERYEAMAREASQMRRALDSWDVISQAKGILMHAHGLGADAAFERLRTSSQRTQLRLADVARQVIAEYTAKDGPPRRGHDLSPG